MNAIDPVEVAMLCGRAFDEIGAGYFLGGSLASSFQGEQRATNDIDFVVDLHGGQATALARALGSDFDVDIEALEEAVRFRRSWNIYFLPTLVKIDIFVKGTTPFDEAEFSRRRSVVITEGSPGLYIKSPEDSVLRKLLWFRAGGEVSSTQWRDVVQVLRISGEHMDMNYLNSWAERLDLGTLLAKARGTAAT